MVERLFPNSTIICLASGPSLRVEDVEYCRGRARVIAVKDAIRLAPWADVVYFCGSDSGRWWQHHRDELMQCTGLRYTLDPNAAEIATVLRNLGETGLSSDPTGLRTGRNSGAQAIGLAVLLGATQIVLLGYDMQEDARGRSHFCGEHPWGTKPPLRAFLPFFEALVQPLASLGIAIVNCTEPTALTCFPTAPLREVLH